MKIIRRKPTSPGVRGRVYIKTDTAKKRPEKSLIVPLKGPSGRSRGTISVRHRQRGTKKFYRLVDFKRNKLNIEAEVTHLEYDPNRNADICLIKYADGVKAYILHPFGLKVGDKVMNGPDAPIRVGNAKKLKNIPLGSEVHNIELNPGAGGVMARSAGGKCIITAKESPYVTLKMPSKEIRKVHEECMATIGAVSKAEYKLTKLGKAGIRRHMGFRPGVRGLAMSWPRKHPHAGSYKKKYK